MKTWHKILILIGALLLLVAAGYFLWRIFSSEDQGGESGDAGDTPPVDIAARDSSHSPSPAGGARGYSPVQAISDHPAFHYALIPETGEIYYLTPEGLVYIVREGPDLEVSRQSIASINRVETSPDGRIFLASFGNPTSPQWGFFDALDSVWHPLPLQVKDATWGRTPRELIAMVVNGSELNLSFIDISKNPPAYTVLIRDFRMEGISFSLLSHNELIIVERPSSQYRGHAWRLDLTTRALTKALSPAPGLIIGSSQRSTTTYLFNSPREFAISDTTFTNRLEGFFTTLPSKCGDYGGIAYCFVPLAIPAKAALPDDYFMRKLYTRDALYRIDLETADLTRIILDGKGDYDADLVFATENRLYFINRYDGRLYQVELEG